MLGELADPPGTAIVGKEVEFAVSVRAEVERLPDPHRVGVVASALGLGDLLHRMVTEVPPRRLHGPLHPALPDPVRVADCDLPEGACAARLAAALTIRKTDTILTYQKETLRRIDTMGRTMKRKNYYLDEEAIREAQRILGTKSETETIRKALELVSDEARLARALKDLLDKGKRHLRDPGTAA